MKFEIYPIMADGGTHKIAGAQEAVEDALQKGANTISVISTGNYLTAIAQEIHRQGLEKQLTLVNLTNHPLNLENISHREVIIEGKRILRNEIEREEYVQDNLPNAGYVRDYTDFQPNRLINIALCMVSLHHLDQHQQLPRGTDIEMLEPHRDYIALGVGTGKLFLALAEKIEEYCLPTKLIGIIPKGENGIFNDANLKEEGGLLYYKNFSSRSVAKALACPYTACKPQLLKTKDKGHMFFQANNDDFFIAWKLAAERGCKGEQSESAGLVLHDKKVRKSLGLQENALATLVYTGFASNERWMQVLEN